MDLLIYGVYISCVIVVVMMHLTLYEEWESQCEYKEDSALTEHLESVSLFFTVSHVITRSDRVNVIVANSLVTDIKTNEFTQVIDISQQLKQIDQSWSLL